MEHREYNGWTNYETWNVKLWIDNDEGSQRYWQEQAIRAIWNIGNRKDAIFELAGQLRQAYRDNLPELNGCYADLMNAALFEVNWGEIAHSLIEDNWKDENETEEN